MDESVSLQAHLWKKARYVEVNIIEIEVNANGTWFDSGQSISLIILIYNGMIPR